MLNGGHGGGDKSHPVQAQRHLRSDLRDGLATITKPDRPVIVLPGRYAVQDLLRIEAVPRPELLPHPLPARPASARDGVPVGDNAQEMQHLFG